MSPVSLMSSALRIRPPLPSMRMLSWSLLLIAALAQGACLGGIGAPGNDKAPSELGSGAPGGAVGQDGGGSGPARIRLLLTDAPTDLTHLILTFDQVSAFRTDTLTWVVVDRHVQTIDLMALQGGEATTIAIADLPAATYSRMALHMVAGTAIREEGTAWPVRMPPDESVYVDAGFDARPGQLLTLTLDFNLAQNVTQGDDPLCVGGFKFVGGQRIPCEDIEYVITGSIQAIDLVYENLDLTPPPAPVLASNTHPNPTSWYNSGTVGVVWSSTDASGIGGYSIAVGRDAQVTPDDVVDTTLRQTVLTLTTGEWYIAARAMDAQGNWSGATRIRVRIDNVPPAAPTITCDTHPLSDTAYASTTAEFAWSATAASGISGYAFSITLDRPATAAELVRVVTNPGFRRYENLGAGTWFFSVRAKAVSGLWGPVASRRIMVDPENGVSLIPPGSAPGLPKQSYPIGKADGDTSALDDEQTRYTRFTGFVMDRNEVTNEQYRQCVSAYTELPGVTCTLPSDTGKRAEAPFNNSATGCPSGYWCTDAGKCAKGCTAPASVGSTPSRPNYHLNDFYARYPVVNVAWRQAAAYCAWKEQRLPTEAEWEYAAHGFMDSRTAYPWGATADRKRANFAGGATADTKEIGSYDETNESTSGAACNQYGAYCIYDMVGNVAEWTADAYIARVPAGTAVIPRDDALDTAMCELLSGGNPSRPPELNDYSMSADQVSQCLRTRVVKGGSYLSGDRDVRISARERSLQWSQAAPTVGFRCVKTWAFAGTNEVCDGFDNDFDGRVDEDFTDTDRDGFADCVDPNDDDCHVPRANGCPAACNDNGGPDPCPIICDEAETDPRDLQDNCPLVCNPTQEDLDGDGIGTACDCNLATDDANGDGICDTGDEPPYVNTGVRRPSDVHFLPTQGAPLLDAGGNPILDGSGNIQYANASGYDMFYVVGPPQSIQNTPLSPDGTDPITVVALYRQPFGGAPQLVGQIYLSGNTQVPGIPDDQRQWTDFRGTDLVWSEQHGALMVMDSRTDRDNGVWLIYPRADGYLDKDMSPQWFEPLTPGASDIHGNTGWIYEEVRPDYQASGSTPMDGYRLPDAGGTPNAGPGAVRIGGNATGIGGGANSGLGGIGGVAADREGNYLYFTSPSGEYVRRYALDPTDGEPDVSTYGVMGQNVSRLDGPTGSPAIDPINGDLYFVKDDMLFRQKFYCPCPSAPMCGPPNCRKNETISGQASTNIRDSDADGFSDSMVIQQIVMTQVEPAEKLTDYAGTSFVCGGPAARYTVPWPRLVKPANPADPINFVTQTVPQGFRLELINETTCQYTTVATADVRVEGGLTFNGARATFSYSLSNGQVNNAIGSDTITAIDVMPTIPLNFEVTASGTSDLKAAILAGQTLTLGTTFSMPMNCTGAFPTVTRTTYNGSGDFSVNDADGDGFSERVSFGGADLINTVTPSSDALYNYRGYSATCTGQQMSQVNIANLQLIPTASGTTIPLRDQVIADGFTIDLIRESTCTYTRALTADIEVQSQSMRRVGQQGFFRFRLRNMRVGADAGSQVIKDNAVLPYVDIEVSFQLNTDIGAALRSGSTVTVSSSWTVDENCQTLYDSWPTVCTGCDPRFMAVTPPERISDTFSWPDASELLFDSEGNLWSLYPRGQYNIWPYYAEQIQPKSGYITRTPRAVLAAAGSSNPIGQGDETKQTLMYGGPASRRIIWRTPDGTQDQELNYPQGMDMIPGASAANPIIGVANTGDDEVVVFDFAQQRIIRKTALRNPILDRIIRP